MRWASQCSPHAPREDVPHAEREDYTSSEQAVKSGRHSAPRFLRMLDRYSCQTSLSFSSSLTMAPCKPAARSCAATSPVPKLPARAMPLASTEIASAVDSTPEGALI